jgi:hypothetical protein
MKGLTLDPGSKIAIQPRLQLFAIVGVVRRLVHHRQNFAGVDVDHDHRTGTCAVFLHRGLQFTVSQILNAQIDTGDQIAARTRRADALDIFDIAAERILDDALRAVFAVQQLVEAKLQSFLALVVHRGESDHMRRHLARRIVAAVFTQQVYARNVQCLDARGLLRRHMAHQIEKLAIEIAGDVAREGLLVFLEGFAELRQLIDVFVDFLWIDPDAVHRRAHRQRLAVAIGDRAPVRRDFHDAHRTVVALLGKKTVIDQLQFDGARRETDRAQHQERQYHRGAPAIGFGRALIFDGTPFHGRTILTSRI